MTDPSNLTLDTIMMMSSDNDQASVSELIKRKDRAALIEGFFKMVSSGNLDEAKMILPLFKNRSEQDYAINAGLHLAIVSQNLTMVKTIITAHPKIPHHEDILHAAAVRNQPEVVRFFYEHLGAEKFHKTLMGSHALRDAAGQGFLEMVKLLIELGPPKMNFEQAMAQAIAHLSKNESIKVVQFLLPFCDISHQNYHVLRQAARRNHVEVCELLLNHAPDLDVHDFFTKNASYFSTAQAVYAFFKAKADQQIMINDLKNELDQNNNDKHKSKF